MNWTTNRILAAVIGAAVVCGVVTGAALGLAGPGSGHRIGAPATCCDLAVGAVHNALDALERNDHARARKVLARAASVCGGTNK